MNPRYRSLSGALIAVFAVPVFLGLTACLPTFPVPVGNPEKSRIDPYISGVWMVEDENTFYIFEPYDKRTWVLSVFDINADPEGCEQEVATDESEDIEIDEPEFELNAYEELVADLIRYGVDCYDSERDAVAVKVWRTKLGGEWFMTWEPLGMFDAETGLGPYEWIVYRIDTSVNNQLRLWMLEEEHEAWDVLDEKEEDEITSRSIEKILRKNADDEAMYYEEPLVFLKVLPEHYELFETFIDSDW